MRHIICISLLQGTLRDARVIQIAETASHTGRPFTPFLRYTPLPGRES